MPRTRASDGNRWSRLLLRYVAIVVSATAVLTAYAGWKNSQDLRHSLANACEDTREPLGQFFQTQIETTKQTDPNLFPGYPPAEFQRLIEARVALLRDVRNAFDVAECDSLYD